MMRKGWAVATSKEHNKGNCSWNLVTLCSVRCTLALPPYLPVGGQVGP